MGTLQVSNRIVLHTATTVGDDLRQLAELADKGILKAYAVTWLEGHTTAERWYYSPPNYTFALSGAVNVLADTILQGLRNDSAPVNPRDAG